MAQTGDIYSKGQKSPGLCSKCCVMDVAEEAWRHKPKDCRNPPFCHLCDIFGHFPTRRCEPIWEKVSFCKHCAVNGRWCDHVYTTRCDRFCNYCMNWGHTMLYCHKIKDCKLCGKSGHNPLRCWKYCSIKEWMARAKELGRCGECLALLPTGGNECTNCRTKRVYWKPQEGNHEECQTEEGSSIIQECKSELQEGKTIIEDLKNKILELEKKLENSNTAINELNWKWTNTLQEKEQEVQEASKLDALCKTKEMELRKLKEQIEQKDGELEHHRKKSAQPSQNGPVSIQQHCPAATQQHCPVSIQQHYPAVSQQHCPASVSNNLGHCNCIKPNLIGLQDQQQKLCMIVNHLYDKVMAHNMSWFYYPNFNPKEGLYDTGQNFK